MSMARMLEILVLLALFPATVFSAGIKWSYATRGYVAGTPLLEAETLFVGSSDGFMYALDPIRGFEKWKFETGGPILGDPIFINGLVVFGSADKNLYALDPASGQVAWKFSAKAPILSSPSVGFGNIYFGDANGTVYAVSADRGQLIWSYATAGPIESRLAVLGGKLFVASGDRFLYALNATTGEKLWTFGVPVALWRSSPFGFGDLIFFGAPNGNVYAVNAETGANVWVFQTGGWVLSSPRIIDGILYVGSNDGSLYALEPLSGKLLWKFDTGEAVQGSVSGTGETVYFGSNDGRVYALSAKNGSLRWSFEIGDWVQSAPVVHGNYVYVGSYDGKVYGLSSLSCSFTSPDSGTVVFEPVINITGMSLSDSGVLAVQVRVGETGAWQTARGTSEWSFPLYASALPLGNFTVYCRAIDIARAEEPPPYTRLLLSRSNTPPRMVVTYPPEVKLGQPFAITIRDERGKPLDQVTITINDLTFTGINGSKEFTAPYEGQLKVTVTRTGYASETFTITASRDLGWLYIGGSVALALLVAAYIFRRR